MTSETISHTNRQAEEAQISGPPVNRIVVFHRGEEFQFELPNSGNLVGSHGPMGSELRKWFIEVSRCMLPFRTLSVVEHEPFLCTNSTVLDSGQADPLPIATSTAVDKELRLETRLVQQFEGFVRQARNETFSDGMDSMFATRVLDSIEAHGKTAVAAWERILLSNNNYYETGEELLRQLGHSRHVPSHRARLRVLIDALELSDPRLRDAAGLGLSFLEDPEAIPKLLLASGQEPRTWVKRNLQMVVRQLESSKWPSS